MQSAMQIYARTHFSAIAPPRDQKRPGLFAFWHPDQFVTCPNNSLSLKCNPNIMDACLTMWDNTKRWPVSTLENSIAILRLFNAERHELTVTEASRMLTMP